MSSHREHLEGLSEDVLSLVDCVLVGEGHSFECHHQIVFSYSPVLAGCSSLTETSSSSPFRYKIPIDGPANSDGLGCMLKYIYSPMSGLPFEPTLSQCNSVAELAHRLNITGLTKKLDQVYVGRFRGIALTPEQLVGNIRFAEAYHLHESLAFLEWAAIRQGALLSDIKLLSQLSSDSLARLLFGVHRADVQGCSNSRCRSCCRVLKPLSVAQAPANGALYQCSSCGNKLCRSTGPAPELRPSIEDFKKLKRQQEESDEQSQTM